MRRKLFTRASALSLLVCAIVIALWIGSHVRLAFVSYCWPVRADFSWISTTVVTASGQLGWEQSIAHARRAPSATHWLPGYQFYAGPPRARDHSSSATRFYFAGFQYDRDTSLQINDGNPKGYYDQRWFFVPYWFLVAVFAVLPARWVILRRSQRRADPSICKTCGYDLRATPDRCPECGSPALWPAAR